MNKRPEGCLNSITGSWYGTCDASTKGGFQVPSPLRGPVSKPSTLDPGKAAGCWDSEVEGVSSFRLLPFLGLGLKGSGPGWETPQPPSVPSTAKTQNAASRGTSSVEL